MKAVYKAFLPVIFISLFSCGIKGYPKQPLSDKPSPIENLKVKQHGNLLVWFWEFNKKYEDGRPITEPYEFYAVGFKGKPKKLKIKNYRNLYWFEEKIEHTKRTYCYKIFVKTRKEESEKSDITCILVARTYPPSPNLKLISDEYGLRLKWSVKTDINVYRGHSRDVPPKIYQNIKKGVEFFDINVKTGNTYCYYITVPVNKHVEGMRSTTLCMRYVDVFPPKPPSDGFLHKEKGYVLLFWEDSPSKDVKGYKIYKNGKPILNMVVKTYYFKDNNYREGDIYYITAVDNAGNESKPLIIR